MLPTVPWPARSTEAEEQLAGHSIEPYSAFSWLYQAWKQLGNVDKDTWHTLVGTSTWQSGILAYGDRVFDGQVGVDDSSDFARLDSVRSESLDMVLTTYFDRAMATYHFLHHPTIRGWLQDVQNRQRKTFGHARTAACFLALAHGMLHLKQAEMSSLTHQEQQALQPEALLACATAILEREQGPPTVDSIQARLIKVHHLLSTCRPNSAWYLFGVVVQMCFALGLHRKRPKQGSASYLMLELQKRTFWAVYATDRYINIAIGRPTLISNDVVSQKLPSAVNDEDLNSESCDPCPDTDCVIEASIQHALLARIVGDGIRQYYIPDSATLLNVMTKNNEALAAWKSGLPPFLSGQVRPLSLIPVFQRQTIVLNIFYLHAILLVNRPSLLWSFRREQKPPLEPPVLSNYKGCIDASRELAQQLIRFTHEGQRSEVFWFTQNISFNAVSILYLHILQKMQKETIVLDESDVQLLSIAEEGHNNLATISKANSPTLKYTLVLDTLRNEIKQLQMQTEQDVRLGDRESLSAMSRGVDAAENFSHLQNNTEFPGFLLSEVYEAHGSFWSPNDPAIWSNDWMAGYE